LILGDILGLNAGLTSALLDMLPRFFVLRPLGSDLRDEGKVDVKGELVALFVDGLEVIGAGVTEPEGVLSGPSFGVFLESDTGLGSLGSSSGSMAKVMAAAASGRDKGGNKTSREALPALVGERMGAAPLGEDFPCCILINDAGVAGPCLLLFITCWAKRAGEWVADAG
jgi:hypothetical protein